MARYTAQEMRDMADSLEMRREFAVCIFDEKSGEWIPVWQNPDTTVLALRQAADDLEREEKPERKYEYSVPPKKDGRVFDSLDGAKLQAFIDRMNGLSGRIVRREVGEWEEVEYESN